ncbi:MAG: endonuclease [Sulfolobaceae archaeon]|nr:endonuclease [Sulfolobaceae archaeon]
MGFGLALSFILLIVIIIIIVYYSRKINKIQQQAQQQAQSMFSQWVQQHSNEIRSQIEQSVETKYKAELDKWKLQVEEQIRRDAITKSVNTLLGKIGEEFAPLLIAQRYNINPKDFRHLGSPVDFIAFKGLSDDSEAEIIFFEIKTGKGTSLTDREKKVRDAIISKKVRYEVVNLNQIMEETKKKMNEEINMMFNENNDNTQK